MVNEVGFSSDKGFEPRAALADSFEGELQAFDGAVALQPVFILHARDNFVKFGSQPIVTTFKGVVEFRNEPREVSFFKVFPVNSEEVIEKYVDDDSGKAASFRRKEIFSFEKDGVVIGEAIDGPVEHDALDDFRGILSGEGGGVAPDEIAQQGTYAGGVCWLGEGEVGEKIHVAQ